jgi:spore maturation protein CgeB
MPSRPSLAFFGSSLASSSANGAVSCYRGIVRALAERGWCVTFFEPADERRTHRDVIETSWAHVVVYSATNAAGPANALEDAREADVIVKAGGVGSFDGWLDAAIASLRGTGPLCLYWDVNAPATLDRLRTDASDPLRVLVPAFDLVLTYGGGDAVGASYRALGARACAPIHNAIDPHAHHPVAPQARFLGDLSMLADHFPDREARVDALFLGAAARLPRHRFRLGGTGWDGKVLPDNVECVGQVPPRDRNAFNCSPLAVLDVNRDRGPHNGHSPAASVFEAAGAGACVITDASEDIAPFLEPGREVLSAAGGDEVAAHLEALTPAHALSLGGAARRHVLRAHTYAHRVATLEALLDVAPRPQMA